jgi:hypothetical protein
MFQFFEFFCCFRFRLLSELLLAHHTYGYAPFLPSTTLVTFSKGYTCLNLLIFFIAMIGYSFNNFLRSITTCYIRFFRATSRIENVDCRTPDRSIDGR